MSYLDSINKINDLTAQINTLKDQTTTATTGASAQISPDQVLYDLQANFNSMLSSLMSDDSDEENTYDPFSSLTGTSQNTISNTANSAANAQYLNEIGLNKSINNLF